MALSEQNARLGNVETTMRTIAEAQTRMAEGQAQMAEGLARTKGDAKAAQERLAVFEQQVSNRCDRIEGSLDRLIELHLDVSAHEFLKEFERGSVQIAF